MDRRTNTEIETAKDLIRTAEDKALDVLEVAKSEAGELLHSKDTPFYFKEHIRETATTHRRYDKNFEHIQQYQDEADAKREANHQELLKLMEPWTSAAKTLIDTRKYTIYIAGFVGALGTIILFGKTIVVFVVKLVTR